MRKIEARFTKTVTRLRKLTDACLAQYLGSKILEKHIEETKGPILIDNTIIEKTTIMYTAWRKVRCSR